MSAVASDRYILTLTCRDRPGIVAGIASAVAQAGFSITESQQHSDPELEWFFMRLEMRRASGDAGPDDVRALIRESVVDLGAEWALHDAATPARVLILVSKQSHCLLDLLYRVSTGALRAEVAAVVSNHDDLRESVAWRGVSFHHVPVTPETKDVAEAELLRLIDEYNVDTVVLARYMQILSNAVCERLPGRVINIHHSLLPSFKGAKPYHQAYARGVKVIGATAHYVTADLDEGPIIEQDFTRVDHRADAGRLTEIGRDTEALALARAVTLHCERRVILHGDRTVVFS